MKKFIAIGFALVLIYSNAIGQEINSSYAIQNVLTGYNLRPYEAMSSNGNKIVMYNHKEWQCMTWDFNQIDGDVYTLKNQYTDKTIQGSDTPAKAGSELVQETLAGTPNQQWEFILISPNNYHIRLKGTNLYITGTGKIDNSAVSLQPLKLGNPMQVWRLIEQHPTG